MSGSEVRFNIGPFSHIIVAIPEVDKEGQPRDAVDILGDAIMVAENLHEKFDVLEEAERDEGPQGEDPGPQERGSDQGRRSFTDDGDPYELGETRPEFRRPQAPQRPQQARTGVETREEMLSHTWGDCPDCGGETKPSKMQYQTWDTTDDGVEVPAKHFCTNQSCPRPKKGMWRRELVESAMPF